MRENSVEVRNEHRMPVLTVTVFIYTDRVVPAACRRLARGGRASRAGDGITTACARMPPSATSHRLRVFVPAFAAWPRAAAPPRRDFPRPGQCEWGARGLVRWPPAERAARLVPSPRHLAYVLDPGSSGRAKLTQVS